MIQKRLTEEKRKSYCDFGKGQGAFFGRRKRKDCFINEREVLDKLRQKFDEERAKIFLNILCEDKPANCKEGGSQLQKVCVESGKKADDCETTIDGIVKNYCKADKKPLYCSYYVPKTTTTTTTEAVPETTNKKSSNGILIGGIIGGVALIIVAIVVFCLCRRRAPAPAITVKSNKIDKKSKASTTTGSGTKTTTKTTKTGKTETKSSDQMY